MKLYYIKNGYIGNSVLWWAKDSKGYTTDIRLAGKYTHEEAKDICKRPEDTAYLCSRIDKNAEAHKLIIDSQYIGKPTIKGKKR